MKEQIIKHLNKGLIVVVIGLMAFSGWAYLELAQLKKDMQTVGFVLNGSGIMEFNSEGQLNINKVVRWIDVQQPQEE